jgi:16S rRNA (adenine1518-N6/adenine1519-N6)-dimethyltransferase
MFQKEVADRLYAVPATKSYGRLSVLTQCKTHIEKVFDLEPGSFFPPPKIKSSVVKLTPNLKKISDFRALSNLLSVAFAHRRKTVTKPLSTFFQNPEHVLQELGYDKNTRAEEISVDDYIKLLQMI